MSDTPRTDDASDDSAYYQSSIEMIPADFARQLERELAAMTKERDELRRHLRAANKGAERNMQALNISTEN